MRVVVFFVLLYKSELELCAFIVEPRERDMPGSVGTQRAVF